MNIFAVNQIIRYPGSSLNEDPALMNNFFWYHGTSLYRGPILGEKVNEGV